MINAILTIDDMPQNNTKAIIDYLCSMGIKCVFFTIGELLEKNPEPALYAISKGFVIGNHTYTHAKLNEISYEEGIEEIEKTEKLLNDLYEKAGVERPVKLFRFPYLATDEKYFDYLEKNGFKKIDDTNVKNEWYIQSGWKEGKHVSCSFDCQEYMLRPGNDFTFQKVLDLIDYGFGTDDRDQDHIILTHSHDETEEAEGEYVRKIVERILSHGAKFIEPKFI
ncbi:MAG: polysaccharide deacetylase family protein [Clostridiales bacterium]|nr:polysaccharide deacetylase family protein [Clostridiales bacterium]